MVGFRSPFTEIHILCARWSVFVWRQRGKTFQCANIQTKANKSDKSNWGKRTKSEENKKKTFFFLFSRLTLLCAPIAFGVPRSLFAVEINFTVRRLLRETKYCVARWLHSNRHTRRFYYSYFCFAIFSRLSFPICDSVSVVSHPPRASERALAHMVAHECTWGSSLAHRTIKLCEQMTILYYSNELS